MNQLPSKVTRQKDFTIGTAGVLPVQLTWKVAVHLFVKYGNCIIFDADIGARIAMVGGSKCLSAGTLLDCLPLGGGGEASCTLASGAAEILMFPP